MSRVSEKLNGDAFVLVLLPIIFIPVIFYNTTLAMMHVWMVNETFTHGFIIFPVAIWLILQKKSQLLLLKPSPEPRIILLLILLLFGWFISFMTEVEIVQQFCMVTIILATIWMLAGRQVVSLVFLPLMFLYFAVPFGQIFIPPLMHFTANFTVALIKMTGVPVFQDGFSFSLPNGSWSVIEECSGVRYLIASFSLGTIYAYLNYSSTKKRVIFILISLIIPIFANGFRAFGIVMIGYFSGMRLAVGVDHILYGWVFFGLIIFLLFYVGSFWRDAEVLPGVIHSEAGEPVVGQKKYSPSGLLFITFLLMILSLVLFSYINNKIKNGTMPVSLQIPENFSSWHIEPNRSLDWQPAFSKPDINISRGYSSGNDFVQLNIAYYYVQRQGAEAISTANKLINPYAGGWRLISTVRIKKNGKHLLESELKKMNEKLLVWSWYQVGSFETTNPYMAKVLEAYNLIIEGRSDASILSIATPLTGDKKITQQKLYGFWKDSEKVITHQFESGENGS